MMEIVTELAQRKPVLPDGHRLVATLVVTKRSDSWGTDFLVGVFHLVTREDNRGYLLHDKTFPFIDVNETYRIHIKAYLGVRIHGCSFKDSIVDSDDGHWEVFPQTDPKRLSEKDRVELDWKNFYFKRLHRAKFEDAPRKKSWKQLKTMKKRRF